MPSYTQVIKEKTTYDTQTKATVAYGDSLYNDFYYIEGILTEDDGFVLLDVIDRTTNDFSNTSKLVTSFAGATKLTTNYDQNSPSYVEVLELEDDEFVLEDDQEVALNSAYAKLPINYTGTNKEDTNYKLAPSGTLSTSMFTVEEDVYLIDGVSIMLIDVGFMQPKVAGDYNLTIKNQSDYSITSKVDTDYIYNLNGITLDDTVYTLDDTTMRLHGFTTSSPPSTVGNKNKTTYEAV